MALALLLLELIARSGPVSQFLDDRLGVYENLLWYADEMPAYRDQLLHGPHYDIWLVGSSYLMSGLDPQAIQRGLAERGFDRLTVQNYGMSAMQNMEDMAVVYDRWMFQMARPEYIVVSLSQQNAHRSGFTSRARSGPLEDTYIFTDRVDDFIAGFLYGHSALLRYAILARNATFIPREQAEVKPKPAGGFVPLPFIYDGCDPSLWTAPDTMLETYQPAAFASIDRLLDVIQAREIPLMAVNIPLTYCGLRGRFPDFETYQRVYLEPLRAHLKARGIALYDLDRRFYEAIPLDEQYRYYENASHPNQDGAALLSQWAAADIADWLSAQRR